MKNILIMGGSYFIGKKIVEIMKESNYNVTTLNRGTKSNQDSSIIQLNCDRNDLDKMRDILKYKNFDIVIDVSCLNAEQASILSQSLNIKNLKKFVFISSSAVYKIEELTIPFIETDLLGENDFWGLYGLNKIKAEKYYESFIGNTDAKLISIRPPYVYGENNYAQRESFIFEHIINNQPILIPKSNCSLQFIYTTDLANIIKTLLNESSLSKINVFNVGNQEAITAKKWIEYCFEAARDKSDIIEYDYVAAGRNIRDFFPFPDYDNILDINKVKKIVKEETNFIFGLETAYKWFIDNRKDIRFKENITLNENQILCEIGYK